MGERKDLERALGGGGLIGLAGGLRGGGEEGDWDDDEEGQVTAGSIADAGAIACQAFDESQSRGAMLHPDGMAMTLIEILVKLRHLTEYGDPLPSSCILTLNKKPMLHLESGIRNQCFTLNQE